MHGPFGPEARGWKPEARGQRPEASPNRTAGADLGPLGGLGLHPAHVAGALQGEDVERVDHDDEASGRVDGFADFEFLGGRRDGERFVFHVGCWVHLRLWFFRGSRQHMVSLFSKYYKAGVTTHAFRYIPMRSAFRPCGSMQGVGRSAHRRGRGPAGRGLRGPPPRPPPTCSAWRARGECRPPCHLSR